MIVTAYVEHDTVEGKPFTYEEIDYNLANIAKITWHFAEGKVTAAEIKYVGGGGGTIPGIIAKKLYPKVRAWQRTLERAPVYAGGGEL